MMKEVTSRSERSSGNGGIAGYGQRVITLEGDYVKVIGNNRAMAKLMDIC